MRRIRIPDVIQQVNAYKEMLDFAGVSLEVKSPYSLRFWGVEIARKLNIAHQEVIKFVVKNNGKFHTFNPDVVFTNICVAVDILKKQQTSLLCQYKEKKKRFLYTLPDVQVKNAFLIPKEQLETTSAVAIRESIDQLSRYLDCPSPQHIKEDFFREIDALKNAYLSMSQFGFSCYKPYSVKEELLNSMHEFFAGRKERLSSLRLIHLKQKCEELRAGVARLRALPRYLACPPAPSSRHASRPASRASLFSISERSSVKGELADDEASASEGPSGRSSHLALT